MPAAIWVNSHITIYVLTFQQGARTKCSPEKRRRSPGGVAWSGLLPQRLPATKDGNCQANEPPPRGKIACAPRLGPLPDSIYALRLDGVSCRRVGPCSCRQEAWRKSPDLLTQHIPAVWWDCKPVLPGRTIRLQRAIVP